MKTLIIDAWTEDNNMSLSIQNKTLKDAVCSIMPDTYEFPDFNEIWKTLDEKGIFFIGDTDDIENADFSLKKTTSVFNTPAIHMKDWTDETLTRYNILFIQLPENMEVNA